MGRAVPLLNATFTISNFFNMETQADQSSSRKCPPNDRELDVLRLIAQGFDHKEIARALFISPETCKSRLKTLRAKLDAPNSSAAIYKAVKEHLLD